MTFTIPDETHAAQGVAHTDLAEPKSRDFEALAQRGTGVKSGCTVTAQSTPDMTLAVASGVVRIAGVDHAVSSGNVTITANSAGQPRYDAVVVDTSGVKSVIAGTPAAETTLDDPVIDLALYCWLAKVYVASGATAITATEFVSKAIPMDVGVLDDTQIPSGVARDAEVTSSISTHAGATDPHGDRAYADLDVATHAAIGDAHNAGAIRFAGIISPTAISATQDDYNPTGLATASTLRLSTSSSTARSISGFAGGADGRILLVHNLGPGNIALLDEGSGSTPGHRFALAGDMILLPDSSCLLQYDDTSSRWRVLTRATAATNPAITFGATNVGGISPYFVRSDDQLIDPTIAHSALTDPHTGYRLESAAIGTSDLAADAVTYAKLQNISAASRILGRITSGSGDAEELTAANLKTILALAASEIAFTPAGSIAATDVQAAIAEMLTEGIPQLYQVPFVKPGLVVVTTEGDTPPPFHWTNDTGKTLTFVAARGRAEIGPSGSTMTLDLNVGGTTIMTGTKVVLPNNTGAVSTVKQTTFSTTTIADGGVLSMNVDTNGGGAVQNLLCTVWMFG